jgi:hypothetical protein
MEAPGHETGTSELDAGYYLTLRSRCYGSSRCASTQFCHGWHLISSSQLPLRLLPAHPSASYARKVIFDGRAQGLRASYPRVAELQDGTLLVTTSLSGGNPPYFPVFQSKDGGVNWKWISNITDQVNGWGMGAQPALTELTEPMGGFDAGTVLAAGNSWKFGGNGGGGTRIDLYASTDRALSWKFVSHIAEGGPPNTTNGATPVWKPFLM